MQKFSDQHRYDQPAATVLDRFTDPVFLKKKYAALGRQDVEFLEHHKDAKEARLRIRYSDKPDMDVPLFARKLVPERAFVTQEVVWDLVKKTGRITVESKGSPVNVKGNMRLQDVAGGCTNTLNWEVSVSVPLVGGKLEKLLIDGIGAKSKKDEKLSRELLAAGV